MNVLEHIRSVLKMAREYFAGTVADITQDMLHLDPGGTAHPLGATYAHLVYSEDMIISAFLQGKKPQFQTTFAGKTGTDSDMPFPGADWADPHTRWAKSVNVDLATLREYEKAVYAQTDAYVASLTEKDLEREVDLTGVGFGKQNVGWVLGVLISGHIDNMVGEIAVLKGIQGKKGYPF